MALDEGVSFARGVGVRDVIFECDSQIIFNTVMGYSGPLATVANIIWGDASKTTGLQRSAILPCKATKKPFCTCMFWLNMPKVFLSI